MLHANQLAFSSHLVEIDPVPEPHGAESPRAWQRPRIASFPIGHREDGLDVEVVADAERALGFAKSLRDQNHSFVPSDRAEPLARLHCR